MTTTTTMTGPCVACGTETSRDIATDKWSEFLNRLPLRCMACTEREIAEAEALDRDRERQAAEELRARKRSNVHRAAGVPAGLRDIRLNDLGAAPEQRTAILAARRLLDRTTPNPPLTLTGGVGRGKTTIAAALCGDLLDDLIPMQWASVPSLVARLDRPFGSTERDAALAVIDGNGGLVLDDLDKTRTTEHVSGLLFAAIDARVASGMPLIVTTNLMPSAIAKRFGAPNGPAITSRLVGGIVVEVGGHDRRAAEDGVRVLGRCAGARGRNDA